MRVRPQPVPGIAWARAVYASPRGRVCRTTVALNGQVVTEYTEGQPVPPRQHDYEPIRGRRPDVGYIGIQNHHEPQTVHCKEISVQ